MKKVYQSRLVLTVDLICRISFWDYRKRKYKFKYSVTNLRTCGCVVMGTSRRSEISKRGEINVNS